MIQGLPEPVRAILDTLRDVTGRDVQFVRKPDLKSLARIRMAGGASAAHVLFYRDEHDPRIHHVIANECGHLIRLFVAPPDKRLVAVANERTQASYREVIREDIQRLSLIHGLDTLRTFIPLWYESVVFQLTRMPPDIMIERWLYEEYPDMRDIQLAALQEQHEKAVSVLSGNIRRMTPGKIYEVSQVMNYVFFRLAGELLGIRLIDALREKPLHAGRGGTGDLDGRTLQRGPRGGCVRHRQLGPSASTLGMVRMAALRRDLPGPAALSRHAG